MGRISSSSVLLICSIFLLLYFPIVAEARYRIELQKSKPDPSDAAATARWLAAENSWGVLSTISADLLGAPFGNVVSFSDGLPGKGLGIPYFYLTALDPTARDALQDNRASFTISEYPLGSCGRKDPENPSCSKLTLSGKLKPVDFDSEEREFAESALFEKHPEMKCEKNFSIWYENTLLSLTLGLTFCWVFSDWPKGHNFRIFRLDIENIFLIDWFGGPKPLTLDRYLGEPSRVNFLSLWF